MTRRLSKNSLLESAEFKAAVTPLYRESLEDVAERYSSLTAYLKGEVHFFSSSGRAEFIGNHTDHNKGLVIAATIDMDVVGAVCLNGSDTIEVNSAGYDKITVKTSEISVDEKEFGTSRALLKGIIAGFLKRGYKVGGFDMNAHSTVFKGAGVSSSASIELLFCEVFNVLFNEGKLDFAEKAKIAQEAENAFFGKPSGLMDQLTISRGGVSFMDFATDVPTVKSAPWTLEGVSAVIINCGGDHCNLTKEYSAIREEMNAVAAFFNKKVLQEVDFEEFRESLPELKKKLSGRAILRAVHFFHENVRVGAAFEALTKGFKETFLALVSESGRSSFTLLQNCYPPADIEQSVPLALVSSKLHHACLACRVHGGGFAGTVLCFVKTEDEKEFCEDMAGMFGKENVFPIKIRNVGAVKVITSNE